MRVKDFEIAIDALSVDGLEIDEFKMAANSGGHVRQVCLRTELFVECLLEQPDQFVARFS